MVSIRRARVSDAQQLQNCNLTCLPENYSLKYYLYHLMVWPQATYVAEDHNGKIVGYTLAKLDDEEPRSVHGHGHLTSVATFRTHRSMGISTKIMSNVHASMLDSFNAEKCSLHVRESNAAALHLYKDKNGYELVEVEHGYYQDGENALSMARKFGDDLRYKTGQYKKHKPKDDSQGSDEAESGPS